MVLVGPNLPHVWKNDAIYYSDATVNARAILIQFVEELFGNDLLLLPEMKGIRDLLADSSQGIKISPETRKSLAPLLEEIVKARGAQKILLLLTALEQIASSDYELLSSSWFSKSYSMPKKGRINDVYDHIMDHFNQKITLEDLADVANMNAAALCRYFKSCTKKTITEFINEIRIGYAFNLLSTKEYTVTQACFESGFNNLSYFNRQFNKVVGYSPSKLRKSLS